MDNLFNSLKFMSWFSYLTLTYPEYENVAFCMYKWAYLKVRHSLNDIVKE